jgi:rhodanese-related sulfurtransferase
MKEVLKANCACTRDVNAVKIPQGISACEVQGTLSSGACSAEIPYIHSHDLKEMIDTGRNPVLLDVREHKELTDSLGHLPGIIHIPVGSISERHEEIAHLKASEIISICKMGGRAKTAAKILSEAGFKNIKVLTGGMNEWNELGLPVKRHL